MIEEVNDPIKFWRRVNKNGVIHPILGQCWEWIGFIMDNGYGKLTGMGLAHRWSWKIHKGNIPAGMNVLHRCDNPKCVRPDHLFLGTQQDNLADMRDKGRQVRGERQGSAVMTEELVRYVRCRYRRYSHKNGTGAIARDLGICTVQVWRIVKCLEWAHVQ